MELQDLEQMHAAESTLHDHLVEFAPVIGQLTATEERFKSMARLADLAVQRARLTERLTKLLADNPDLPRAQFGRARSWIQRCDRKRTEDGGADGEDASPSGMKPSSTWSSMDTVGSRSSADPDEEPLPEAAAEASASAPVSAQDYHGDTEGDDEPKTSRSKKGRRRCVPPLPPPPAKGILKAPPPAPPSSSEPAESVAIKQIKRVLLCLPGTRLGGVVQLFQPGRVDAIPPTQLEEFRKQAAAGTLPHVDEHWWARGNVPVRDWPTPTLYGRLSIRYACRVQRDAFTHGDNCHPDCNATGGDDDSAGPIAQQVSSAWRRPHWVSRYAYLKDRVLYILPNETVRNQLPLLIHARTGSTLTHVSAPQRRWLVAGAFAQSTLPMMKQVMLSCTVEVDDLALRPWVLNVTHPGLPPVILGATSQASFQRWRQALTSAAAFTEDPSTCCFDCVFTGPLGD